MKAVGPLTKVHYRGKNDDFIIWVENVKAVQEWKNDKTVPMAQVVDGFKIFVTHKQGTQGIHDTASKGALEDEFGTHKDDDVMQQILEKGTVIESEEKGRDGGKNDSKGARQAH